MLDVQFRRENEIKTQYSTRILQDEWASYEDEIKRLHGERKTKVEILEALKSASFYPSMPQLNKQMRRWGLKVYGQPKDAPADLQRKDGPASDTDTLTPPSTISSHVDILVEIETEIIEHAQDYLLADYQGTCFSETGHHGHADTQVKEDLLMPVAVDNISMLDASSETSSMRKFHALAVRLNKPTNASSHSLPNGTDTMSICSRDSWSFRRVTGMPVNSSTERLRTPDSSLDQRRMTFFAPGSEEDLRKLQMSPLLPLRQSLKIGAASMKLSCPPRNERKSGHEHPYPQLHVGGHYLNQVSKTRYDSRPRASCSRSSSYHYPSSLLLRQANLVSWDPRKHSMTFTTHSYSALDVCTRRSSIF
jgi:hypothetical protein